MKRSLIAGLLGLVLLVGASGPAAADSSTLFGQTQSYDVLVRANGKAITTARIEISNEDAPSVNQVSYGLVGAELSEIVAYQEVECAQLPVLTTQPTAASSPTAASPTASTQSIASGAPVQLPECYPTWLSQQSRANENATGQTTTGQGAKPLYYYPSGSIYKKLTVSQNGKSFTLTLPQPVTKGKSATIVMSYTATGYVRPAWGGYDFTFQSLSTPGRTSDVNVAVSVDEDYQLAGAGKSKVVNTPTTAADLGNKLQAGASASSSARAYVDGVGANGSITKHASSLSADETFKVSGRFAEHALLLNPAGLAVKVVVLAGLVVAGLWWWRRRRGRRRVAGTPAARPAAATVASTDVSVTGAPSGRMSGFVTAIRERRLSPRVVGWLCGALTAVTVAAMVLGTMATASMNSYGSFSDFAGILSVLSPILIITSGILASLLAAVGLPLWYGSTARQRATAIGHTLLALVAATLLVVSIQAWNYYNRDSSSGNCKTDYCTYPD